MGENGEGDHTCLGSIAPPPTPMHLLIPWGPVPPHRVLSVTCPCLFLQLVSDTRRVSDIQWFREAYGALTQTVRVVASEQSRRQRGWVFTPGELRPAFAPEAWHAGRHPAVDPGPRLHGLGLLPSSWQAVGA